MSRESGHIVVSGDCSDPVSGLASLPDGGIASVIADPPYGEEAHTKQRRVSSPGGSLDFAALDFAALDFAALDFAAKQFARLARRWVVVFCQVEQSNAWRERLTHHGLEYVRTAVWVKPDGQPQYTGDRPGMGYESLVIAHQPGRKAWNGGGKHGVWTCNKIGPDDRERTGHMTQKPLALMESLIRDFTDPGELVCDPFAGSGTTGVACKRLGRRFIGWERDPKYAAVAQKRIDAAHEQYVLGGPKPAKPKQALLGIE